MGAGVCPLLIIQQVAAALIVILLNELLQKGYGLGSGISLFIATNICESIIWKAFFPTTVNTDCGPEFEGAIVALLSPLYMERQGTCSSRRFLVRPFTQLHEPARDCRFICRRYLLVGLPCRLPVKSSRFRGQRGAFRTKLFYTSNIHCLRCFLIVSHPISLTAFWVSRWCVLMDIVCSNLLIRQ